MYKLTHGNMVQLEGTGTWIPMDPENRHYKAFLEWSKTNTPTPADPVEVPVAQPTIQDVLDLLQSKSLITRADVDSVLAVGSGVEVVQIVKNGA